MPSFDTKFLVRSAGWHPAEDLAQTIPAVTPETQLLARWTDVVLAEHYAQSPTSFGRLLYEHIERQVRFARSPEMTLWFARNEHLGFSQALVTASVVCTDFAKEKAEVAAEGVQRHQRLTEAPPPYGRLFSNFGPLEGLYMHAVAGEFAAQATFTTFAAQCGWIGESVDRLAAEMALAVRGHDGFCHAWGSAELLPILQDRHRDPALKYPKSVSPSGFIVQALDRLDALHPQTMLRYVIENHNRFPQSDPGERLSIAVRRGILDNLRYCEQSLAGIKMDAQQVLNPEQFEAFSACPVMQNFEAELARAREVVAAMITLDDTGCSLNADGATQRVASLEEFMLHYQTTWDKVAAGLATGKAPLDFTGPQGDFHLAG